MAFLHCSESLLRSPLPSVFPSAHLLLTQFLLSHYFHLPWSLMIRILPSDIPCMHSSVNYKLALAIYLYKD